MNSKSKDTDMIVRLANYRLATQKRRGCDRFETEKIRCYQQFPLCSVCRGFVESEITPRGYESLPYQVFKLYYWHKCKFEKAREYAVSGELDALYLHIISVIFSFIFCDCPFEDFKGVGISKIIWQNRETL